MGDSDGVKLGFEVGTLEGVLVGSCDGCIDGRCEGEVDGSKDGKYEGRNEGILLLSIVGRTDGIILGEGDIIVGESVSAVKENRSSTSDIR